MSEPKPPRELNDPRELRAITHPVRIRILEDLVMTGPATATELSERIGETPANCSWHLRQLAKFGWVEEAGGGTGRQRPWQLVVQLKYFARGEVDEDLRIATTAVTRHMVAREYQALRAWFATVPAEATEWRDAAFVTQNVGWCTPEELAEIAQAVSDACDRYVDRINDPSRRPPGARPIRFLAWGVPGQPLPISEDPESRDP